MKITKYQRDLMEHTISGHNRNWFGTSYGGKDSEEFEKLVIAGLATRRAHASWMGDDVIYSLTKEGKALLNKRG